MTNKVKTTVSIAPETDYEIRRLAKLWRVPIAQAWERCGHFAASEVFYRGAGPVTTDAHIRQAEAKVEMLRASN